MTQEIHNYRITFGDMGFLTHANYKDYKKNFWKIWPVIDKILLLSDQHKIDQIWWFIEPYAEVTWIDPSGKFIHIVKKYIDSRYTEVGYEIGTPSDGYFADWVGNEQETSIIGPIRHTQIARLSRCLLEKKKIIEDGIGWYAHYTRCCHVLANQIGITNNEEGAVLLQHAAGNLMLAYNNKKTDAQGAIIDILNKMGFSVSPSGGLSFLWVTIIFIIGCVAGMAIN